jgi:hypothetical protein
MISKRMIYFLGASYVYGFQRQWNGEFVHPHLFVERTWLCMMNGALYIVPPFSIFHFARLCNRIEIKISNKNPDHYAYSYEELFFRNKNVL